MSAYQFLAAEPTILVVSPEIVQDAQRVTARAVASDVVFSLPFAPYPTGSDGTVVWTSEAIAQQLDYWAGVWDANAAVPGVLGIGLSQAINPAGVLKDVAIVTVSSSSGKSTAQLELFPHDFFRDTFPPRIEQARAQLDALEAAG